MTVLRGKRSSKIARSPTKVKQDVNALVESMRGVSFDEKHPLSISETKRGRILADVQQRGYHVLLGRRGLRALVMKHGDSLVDQISGRPITFRRGRWIDRRCHSDDDASVPASKPLLVCVDV